MHRFFLRLAAALLIASFTHGCSEREPRPVFAACQRNADCESGLFCAQGGPLVGHCARFCDEDKECIARYGASHMCGDSVCTQICGWLNACSDDRVGSFQSCGEHLRCRAERPGQCASQCTAPSWGTVTRSAGWTSDFVVGSVGIAPPATIGGSVAQPGPGSLVVAGGPGGGTPGGTPSGVAGGVAGTLSGTAGSTPGGAATGGILGGFPGGAGATMGAAGGTPGGTALGGTTGGGTPGGGQHDAGGLDAGAPNDASAPSDASAASDAGLDAATILDAAPPTPQPCSTLPATDAYARPGPFDAKVFNGQGPGANYTVIRPDTTLGMNGFRHPIAVWAVDLLTSASNYRTVLSHLASHGFVVVACDDFQQPGCASQALAWLATQNASGPLQDQLDLTREATLGHGYGALGALETAARANTKATVLVHPMDMPDAGLGSSHAPLLMMTSTNDGVSVPENLSATLYTASNVPTFFGTLNDSSILHYHILEPRPCTSSSCAGSSQELASLTAWLRLWVCDDQGARKLFMGSTCTLCQAPWSTQRKPAEFWQ